MTLKHSNVMDNKFLMGYMYSILSTKRSINKLFFSNYIVGIVVSELSFCGINQRNNCWDVSLFRFLVWLKGHTGQYTGGQYPAALNWFYQYDLIMILSSELCLLKRPRNNGQQAPLTPRLWFLNSRGPWRKGWNQI